MWGGNVEIGRLATSQSSVQLLIYGLDQVLQYHETVSQHTPAMKEWTEGIASLLECQQVRQQGQMVNYGCLNVWSQPTQGLMQERNRSPDIQSSLQVIHQESTHKAKLGALKGLGKDISPHLLGGAVMKIEFTCIMKMTNEEVFGFNMFGPLGAGNIAILHQRECTHIVLIHNVCFDVVPLGFEELTSPEDITNLVVKSNNLAFARTFGWDFVFGR